MFLEPHAKDAWYIGPAMQNYCCYIFWVPEIQGTRIAKTAKFFLLHCLMPTINEGDAAMLTAKDLAAILIHPKTAKIMDLIRWNYKALEDLVSIFDNSTSTRNTKKNIILQRVHN